MGVVVLATSSVCGGCERDPKSTERESEPCCWVCRRDCWEPQAEIGPSRQIPTVVSMLGQSRISAGSWDYRIFVEASSLDLPGMWEYAGHKRYSS